MPGGGADAALRCILCYQGRKLRCHCGFYKSDGKVMWDLHTTTDMKLLLLVCLLTWPGITSAEETGFVTVAEGDDAVLPCSLSSKENIQQMIFDWKKDEEKQKQVFYYVKGKYYNYGLTGQDQQFIGRVSHFQDELKFGNASIKIRNTELADNGSYTCIFPEKQNSHITLYVGAAPKPYVKPIHDTNKWSLLLCEVQGVPKPTVEWKDSAGNILPAGEPKVTEHNNRFYVTLQIVVTKADNFTCVATQETIHHQINSTLWIHFPVSDTSTPWIICGVLGVLLLVVVIGAVLCVHLKKNYMTGPTSISESVHLSDHSHSG
ncbi:putative selection and upkeep of intraepithelial T-cells protein 1 homolog isoform X2 [Sphaeramia orbicularis]|uniref:putative selection and upkeep of intraepithelial T-cells protein 1 homolog isoform X2 n=1 Tax=Sphaeramia orbicularis TaxID=375764 RepID=UPI00117C4DEA|nr:putative selection and upkeep of intraepithelial T-cells protein 1 homolog isoform X2 [Sphaeramia orbicularis]